MKKGALGRAFLLRQNAGRILFLAATFICMDIADGTSDDSANGVGFRLFFGQRCLGHVFRVAIRLTDPTA